MCWPREAQSSIRVPGRAGDCSRVTAGQQRPHLGLCPGPKVPLQGQQGSRGSIPDSPGESDLVSMGCKGVRSPLESRRFSIAAAEWPKGVKPPVEFGKRTRDCTPGHEGKEGPHFAMAGASRGFSRAAAPVWGFSRGTTGISGSLSCGAR